MDFSEVLFYAESEELVHSENDPFDIDNQLRGNGKPSKGKLVSYETISQLFRLPFHAAAKELGVHGKKLIHIIIKTI